MIFYISSYLNHSVLNKNNLNLIKSQRYVIAQALSEGLINSDSLTDDFVKLHYAVGNPNININEVFNEIINKYPSL